jgi:VanZ like family
MNKRFQAYLTTKWPAIIWSAVVFVLLAMPGSGLLNETWFSQVHLDKLVHAILFFILTWLWVHYLKRGKKMSTSLLLFIGVIATLYGIAMEYIQLHVGRDFSVGDMVADGVGAFLGVLIARKK